MLLASSSAFGIIVAVAALVFGNIEAFISNRRQWHSVSLTHESNDKRGFRIDTFPLFANSDSKHDDDDDENVDFSCDMNTDPPVLDWDLRSLLSSDPSIMDARSVPLMQVYDAAASAAKEKAQLESDDSHEDGNNISPSHAPSILPSDTSEALEGPVQSFGYKGPLSPSVAPYRMFVREYSRDMGHNGRFTVFGDNREEESSSIGGERAKNQEKNPTLQSDVVFSMDDPLAFIRDNLSYGGIPNTNGGETVVYIPGPHTTHGPRNNKNIYCDNLISHNDALSRSSPERLKYISQVLDGLRIAQIHAGTHIDQGNLDIELTSDTINNLLSFGLLSKKCRKDISLLSLTDAPSSLPKKARYRLRARDLDIIQTVLSRTGVATLPRALGDKYLGSDSKGLKDTLIRLIDIAVRSVREENPASSSSSSPHLVLMTYSATSNVLVAALSEWKRRVTTPIEESDRHLSDNESTNAFCRDGVGVGVDENSFSSGGNFRRKVFSEQEAELLLHKALTVVTISATSQGFVDGPAYIHVSMNDDPLASILGVTKKNPDGGGKDAVIMQALSPYLIDEEERSEKSSFLYQNDAHNIDSCVVQYLSLVRRINGVTSFREMYNVGIADADSKKLDISSSLFAVDYRSVGQLVIPPRIDCELIPAMIRATGGERWLWNPDFQLGEGGVEGFDSPLPSLEYAQAELENQLGYNSYDEIVENCWCRWK